MVRIRTREASAALKSVQGLSQSTRRLRNAGVRTVREPFRSGEERENSPSGYAQDRMRYAAETMKQGGTRVFRRGAVYAVQKAVQRKQWRTDSAADQPGGETGEAKEIQRETGPVAETGGKTEEKSTERNRERVPGARKVRERNQGNSSEPSFRVPEPERDLPHPRAAEQAAADAAAKSGKRKDLRNRAEKAAQAVREALSDATPRTKALAAGLAAVGILVLLLCLGGVFSNSALGILLSEEAGNGANLRRAMQEISMEFAEEIDAIRAAEGAERTEISGTQVPWKEVLAVYAVRAVSDPENPEEVLRMTEEKEEKLRSVFRDMNGLSWETSDTKETGKVLYVEIRCRTPEEMTGYYAFSRREKEQLDALLSAEDGLWLSVLYGAGESTSRMVSVALSQLGNAGGQPYWSWYGFSARVDWCACFVSWCADRCGYLEDGTMPQFAWCPYGVEWFQARGLWAENYVIPEPGMIVFFDWDGGGTAEPQDGVADHTGIVERVENGMVWTVEGNRENSCRERHYPVGHYEILGYGMRGNPSL